ncbi:tRNA1(Val) (adenine(37)-N6)-methyltransferase [Beijerinckia indica]|uniref:Methyltransferase small n=1 Tax=Beijerinckia indica subsp. indica (strain ATCC 9039 / DSM 1715 / NCIMB 8712) TaxID=395963 RepID=B2IF35_BEII9|nr:methyltransferase [Beijerinckia indica]ACB95600.1 methyltransferase small [Beijerinckia indica subsp. indica ATCC 9039]
MTQTISDSETTTDRFLDGALVLRQPRKGHRSGTDAILLAAAAPGDFEGHALDLGAGVGAAGLALAVKRPHLTIGLVEREPGTAQLAAENLHLNQLAERGHVFVADLLSPASRREAGLKEGAAQMVITNPPFYDPACMRPPQDARRRQAAMMEAAGPVPLERWIGASLALLAADGLFLMIHRPEVLGTIIGACAGRAGALVILPIQTSPKSCAKRVLIRARKGSRAPLAIAPPLVLQNQGRFTDEAEAIHRGTAFIDWP